MAQAFLAGIPFTISLALSAIWAVPGHEQLGKSLKLQMKLPRQATPFKGLMNRIIWAASPAFLGGFFPAQPSLYQRLGAGAKTGCKVPIKLCIERRHVFCSQEMLCKRSTHLFFIAVAWSEGRPMLKSSRRRHRGELAALLHRGHPLPVHRRCRDGMDGIRLSRSGH